MSEHLPPVASLAAVSDTLVTLNQAPQPHGLNKRKVGTLVELMGKIVVAVVARLQTTDRDADGASMDRLTGDLRSAEDTVRYLRKLDPFRALLRREDIGCLIKQHLQRLTDDLKLFDIPADEQPDEYLGTFLAAQKADSESVKAEFDRVRSNDDALIKRLELVDNKLEAMSALHIHLYRKADRSYERGILQDAMFALQRSTQQQVPEKPHAWTITSYDVDISPDIIGESGSSTVRKGTWDKNTVAVESFKSCANKQMLAQEIKVWKGLRHNNILPFYGASLDAKHPFLVSRYMPNGNISDYLKNINPNANRVKLAHDIALGMFHLHSRGIMHGDLKGANIVIDDSGGACITDFGLSRIKYDATSLQSQVDPNLLPQNVKRSGTLRYMSPEAMTGNATKTSDIYSYAMTLYEIFTDEPPFLQVPHQDLYGFIARERNRLEQPREPQGRIYEYRGLTQDMWKLIMSASEPRPRDRPKFFEIMTLTERLHINWLDVLRRRPLHPSPASGLVGIQSRK